MRSELNYAGKNLSEFGMWFDNSKVYKKPAKRFMGYDIPARNGTLYQSENKFNNVVIEFDCFIKDNFDQNYHDLVNFLNSFDTYQKLINSYNTDMFRMALFHEAIEVDTGQFLKDGRFKLFFDCKPQEFYTDGSQFERIIPHYDIYTGNPAKLVNEGESSVISLRVALEPIQAGSGEPSPSNVRPISGHTSASVTRTGKNLLQINNNVSNTYTHNGVTYTFDRDSQGNLLSITANGTATGGNSYVIISVFTNMQYLVGLGKPIKLSGASNEGGRARLQWWNYNGNEATAGDNGNGSSAFIPTSTAGNVAIQVSVNETVHNAVYKPMILLADETDRTYEPYQGNTYTIDLNGTVYGGTVDLATGVLTVTHGFVTFDGSPDESWGLQGDGRRCGIGAWLPNCKVVEGTNRTIGALSNLYEEKNPSATWASEIGFSIEANGTLVVRQFTTNTMTTDSFKAFLQSNPMQICYPLQTPQTVQLTAQQISLLTGINYISSSDEVTVTTSTPLILKNPSPMTAKPVFKFNNITAPFTVSANGETVISFQNAIRLVRGGIVNNMFFNATGTNLIMQKQGTPNYEETSFLINSGWLPAGRYFLATMPIGNLEVTSMDGTHLYSSGGTFTLSDITQVKVWYVITPDASTPQNFNYPIYLRPLGTLYVDSELMDCYMLDGNTAYSFNECVSLPKDFLQLDERTVMTMTSGAVGFIAPNWWRL